MVPSTMKSCLIPAATTFNRDHDTQASYGILDREQFDRLPADVRAIISTLLPSQLDALRRAICPGLHFPFLRLPVEVHCIIYELLFATESGRLSSCASPSEKPNGDNKRQLFHIWEDDGDTRTPLLGLEMLRLSKTIYAEAHGVLRSLDVCILTIPCELNNPPSDQVLSALQHFRKIELHVELNGWDVGEMFSTANKIFTVHTLDYVVSHLEMAYLGVSTAPPATLSIIFHEDRRAFPQRDLLHGSKSIFDPAQRFRVDHRTDHIARGRYGLAFLLPQLQYLVANLRYHLSTMPNITITTNIDTPHPSNAPLETVRVSPFTVKFRKEENIQGEIFLLQDKGSLACQLRMISYSLE